MNSTTTPTAGKGFGAIEESKAAPTTKKPDRLPFSVCDIPESIRKQTKWVNWKWIWSEKKRKFDKPPLKHDGSNAKSTDPATWTNFQVAATLFVSKRFDGVGYVLTKESGVVGIDLDDCRDPTTGEIREPAASIIRLMDTYTEVSPSGTGVKMLCHAKIPEKNRKADHEIGIEVYGSGRYFTITSFRVPRTSATINERQSQLDELLRNWLPQENRDQETRPVGNTESDIELARMALKSLSPSRADGYWDWLQVGMSLHTISPELLPDWDAWSALSGKYESGACAQKWASFDGSGIGPATLFGFAKIDGWKPPKGWRRHVEHSQVEEARSKITEEDDDPHRLARTNLARYQNDHKGELKYYRDEWWKWKDGCYVRMRPSELAAKVNWFIKLEFDRICLEKTEAYESWRKSDKYDSDKDKGPPKPQKVTRGLVNNVIAAMESRCVVPSSIEIPCWLPTRTTRHLVSVANGILDLEKIDDCTDLDDLLMAHSPNWFSPVKLKYPYLVAAHCPRWLEYLDYVMEGDVSRIMLLQEWCGYLLTTRNDHQKFLALEGLGGNGKSVFFAGVEAMLGEDNVSHVPVENFGGRFDLGVTLGKAVNISNDVGEIENLAEGIIKQFVGGDTMTFDRKNLSPISAPPTAKLMMSWNGRPRIADKSDGMWRRLIVVPFNRRVDERTKVLGMNKPAFWINTKSNPNDKDDQSTEVSGILLWAMLGLHRLNKQGRFTESKACSEFVKEYKLESSPVAMFDKETCESDPDGKADPISSDKLYRHFREWCEANGNKPCAKNSFFKQMKTLHPGLEKRRATERERIDYELTGRPWLYRGVKYDPLKEDEPNPDATADPGQEFDF